jgi:hypothetical protein
VGSEGTQVRERTRLENSSIFFREISGVQALEKVRGIEREIDRVGRKSSRPDAGNAGPRTLYGRGHVIAETRNQRPGRKEMSHVKKEVE